MTIKVYCERKKYSGPHILSLKTLSLFWSATSGQGLLKDSVTDATTCPFGLLEKKRVVNFEEKQLFLLPQCLIWGRRDDFRIEVPYPILAILVARLSAFPLKNLKNSNCLLFISYIASKLAESLKLLVFRAGAGGRRYYWEKCSGVERGQHASQPPCLVKINECSMIQVKCGWI